MTDFLGEKPVATVVRYELAKVRAGQMIIPVAFFASLVARYIQNPITLLFALGTYVAVLVAFVRARRSYGRHSVSVQRGKIHFGADGEEIWPSRITTWTLEGATARLYGAETTWKLRTASGEEQALLATLKSVLGKPVGRHRKGSRRARLLSLGVFVSGVICVAIALPRDIVLLGLLGIAATLVGMTAFLTLSQKIIGSTSAPD